MGYLLTEAFIYMPVITMPWRWWK